MNNGDREVLLGAIDSREAETKVLPAAMVADTRMPRKILEPEWLRITGSILTPESSKNQGALLPVSTTRDFLYKYLAAFFYHYEGIT